MSNIGRLISALTIFFGLLATSCDSGNEENIIGLNEYIHHDDFEYSVTAFTRSKQIISVEDTLITKNIFYQVHFKVVNKALRVSHKWDNTIAVIVDENGNKYENNIEMQNALNKAFHFGFRDIYNTPNGTSDTTILVFEIPRDIYKPFLMVRGGTLMGDVFDGGKFRKIKIRLF